MSIWTFLYVSQQHDEEPHYTTDTFQERCREHEKEPKVSKLLASTIEHLWDAMEQRAQPPLQSTKPLETTADILVPGTPQYTLRDLLCRLSEFRAVLAALETAYSVRQVVLMLRLIGVCQRCDELAGCLGCNLPFGQCQLE